jgi:WD40 repeat protein
VYQNFIETSAYVQGYAIEEQVYLLSDRRVQVFDANTRARVQETQLFEKDGLARSFAVDADYIYCTDFVQLYVLDKLSLELIAQLQLGQDLSSDICSVTVDQNHVYLGIRNGPVVRVRKGLWEGVESYPLSTSSIWTMHHAATRIFAGNVEGQLLEIDPVSMSVTRQVQAHRQNLKSLCIAGNLIGTASQDKALAFWDRETLELVKVKRNAHKKAFAIAGIWKGRVLTISYSSGEIKVWDLATLEERVVVPIDHCLSGQALLRAPYLYLSSRAINGIDRIDLEALVSGDSDNR